MSIDPINITGPKPLNVTPAPAPNPIATLDELTNSHNAIVYRENKDRAALSIISNPPRANVRNTLLTWTSRGFPNNFPIISISITPPPICSDGIKRNFTEYIPYLLGTTIEAQLTILQPMLVDMILSYSIVANTLRVHVSSN